MIEFNPGHHEEINKFLKLEENTVLPDVLASLAVNSGQVEQILLILSQELGNGALTIEYFDILVDELKKTTDNLTSENIDIAVELLQSYTTILKKGTQNARLIMQCLRHIQAENQKTIGEQKPTFLDGESRSHIAKIIQDYELVQRVLEEKGNLFKQVYVESLSKVKEFLK